jgi:tyrocidine synthetase-3
MIIKRFQHQVERDPQAVAVKTIRKAVTYGELWEYSHRVAASFPPGIAGLRVGLLFQHGIDMIASMVGSAMAGAVYVPLDRTYPESRLVYMLQNSGARMILTNAANQSLAERLAGQTEGAVEIVVVDRLKDGDRVGGRSPLKHKPDSLAYILYTSGSTGLPKGVKQTRENLLYYVENWIQRFSLGPGERVTFLTAFSHDGAQQDIWSSLVSGATLCPFDIKLQAGTGLLGEWVLEEKITIWHSVPTLFRYFIESLPPEDTFDDLRWVLLGGEPLRERDVELFDNNFPHAALANVYGQTESSVNSIWTHRPGDSARLGELGEPLSQTELLLVDEEGEMVEDIGSGEIVVACRHIAPGYWEDEEATEDKFSDDPDLGPLYWTGDLGGLKGSGAIEILGRRDFQVKIRGFRVETGEIESCLLRHEAVAETVVTLNTDAAGEPFLCAYIVAVSGRTAFDVNGLRQFTGGSLPDYMVPALFVVLEKMPLTPNGKIDRQALPEPKDSEADSPKTPLSTATEEELAAIWAKELKLEPSRIFKEANFFELGGHSLKGINVIAAVHRVLHVKLELEDIFIYPRLQELAAFIDGTGKGEYESIPPAPPRPYYQASSQQRRLYFLQQMAPDSTAYNLPDIMEFNAQLNPGRIRDVFRQLTQRHESLRTSFRLHEGYPVQVIAPDADVPFECFDFSSMDVENPAENQRVLETISQFLRPFQLDTAPLLRAALISLGGNRQLFLLDAHHIIADGTSLELFAVEFRSLYEGKTLPPLRLQYKDYSEWLLLDGRQGALMEQEKFWTAQFPGEIPVLELPTDFPRPTIRGFDGGKFRFSFDPRLSKRLREMVANQDVTLYMALLAMVNALLHKLSRQEDIVVGTPVAGRQHADVQGLLGMFVNTLPLRSLPAKEKRFSQLLQETRQTTLKAFENQDYPFEDLVEKVAVQRDTSRSPIFDVMFGLHNQSAVAVDSAGFSNDLKVTIPAFQRHIAKFDLTFHAIEGSDALMFSVEYSTQLFKTETVERFVRYLEAIALAVTENPDLELRDIDILSPTEKQFLLEDLNDTAAPYPKDQTIYQLFSAQAAQTPDNIAIEAEGQRSYRELHAQSERFACRLRRYGAGPGSIVPFVLDRSMDMMTVIYGILAVGAAYLPIVPSTPPERIALILEDCAAPLAVVSRTHDLEFAFEGERLFIEDFNLAPDSVTSGESRNCKNRGQAPSAGPRDPLYVIYTSGSTGLPKGVVMENRPVVNRLWWMQRAYPLNATDVLLQKTTVMFDVSVWELFWWSFTGARLALLGPGGEKFPEAIVDAVKQFGVTTIHFVPSMLQAFLRFLDDSPAHIDYCRSLKRVFASGEALEIAHVEGFKTLLGDTCSCSLINLYGPTEAAVDVSCFECPLDPIPSAIPIGAPIDNTSLLVMDDGELQPLGVRGELWIGGDQLARGYLNRPELTAERFVHVDAGNGNRRYYRSGDLATWKRDSNIHYLGRIDDQVKLRGFRIELGEIQHCLLRHPVVQEALVMVTGDNTGDPALTAYMVVQREGDEVISDIRASLTEMLPEYMIPTFMTPLDSFPLTPSGKIDRRALPSPVAGGSCDQRVPVSGPWEEKLAELWSEVLGVDTRNIGATDNFFRLGGHSLKATVLASYIHRDFDVRLPLPQIFKTPTVRGLANFIQSAAKQRFHQIHPAEPSEFYPLSSAQKRMYILQQLDGDGTVYHIPQAVSIAEAVDPQKIRMALEQVIRRHESFRTSFVVKDGEPVQQVHDEVEVDFAYYEENGDSVMSRFIRPFDLTAPPLLRMALVKVETERFLLLADMHHIISDGVSMDILVRDFLDFYNGVEPQPLTLQYKDFAVWQNSQSTWALLQEQREFWLEPLSGELPVLDVPLDYSRPAVQDFSGDAVSFEIGPEPLQALRRLAADHDATLFMALLAVTYCWLFYLSRQEDIIVGAPVAGRSHADCAGIIGMFVNTLALRARPSAEKSFTSLLEEVRDGVLKALDNQDFPFEELVDQVEIGRDAGRNPLFDVMFSFHEGGGDQNPEAPAFGNTVARFDLTVTAMALASGVKVTVEYGTKLFRRESIRQFCRLLEQVAGAAALHPSQPLGQLDIVTPEEKARILEEFNDTSIPFPEPCTIPALFERQVAAHPNGVALEWGGTNHLTYEVLNRNAAGLAGRLIARGAPEQAIVALVAERGEAMISGIMGILKAGCAYLPIDPGYPEARVRFMLQDSGAAVAVTTSHETPYLEGIDIIRVGGEVDRQPAVNNVQERVPLPRHLAYIIYTSGTTGKPKGTLTTHRNAVRVVKNTNYIDIVAGDRLLQLSNFAFDGSIFDIFGALLNGAALLLLSKEEILSAKTLCNCIQQRQATVFFITTALFNTLVDLDIESLRGVRHILFGGERVSVEHARKALSHLGAGTVIHVYGPTETTVFASHYPLRDIEEGILTIPIGKPIANTSLYVLSKTRELLPIGVPGEIYIGGPGLARGYLNRPQLTTEKFVADPFDSLGRLYASGDLGRFLEDGDVEFIGRIDQQLKIRGFRIEPAEIQQHLLGVGEIRDAVVVPIRDQHDEILLAAYIVANDDLDLDHLRRQLKQTLPEYMIPAAIIPLEAIPLNPNGKVDRSALPSPRMAAGKTITPPRSRLEERLRDIWAAILGIDAQEIGIDSGFFEIGGHSLRATVLAAKIQKILGVKIPLTEIFRNPTIRGIGNFLKQAAPASDAGPEPVEKRDYYPLTSQQRRMYLVQSMQPDSTLYNMPYPMVLNRRLEVEQAQAIFNELLRRHESLRTCFRMVGGEPAQVVLDEVELTIESLETGCSVDEAAAGFIRPFQLSEAPLLRVALGAGPKGQTILLVDMHHIISDGTTIGILLRDVSLLAENRPLPALPLQYKDYACWQQNHMESPAGAAQEAYWIGEFAGELPVLDLPLDTPRTPRPSPVGQSLAVDIPPDVTSLLRELAGNLNISVFMLSVGLLNLLLAALSGQEDIVTGTVVAGRRHDQLSDVAGMFVNTLPLRNFPRLDRSCADFLRECGDRALEAFENQDVQFERLVERLSPDTGDGRQPLFDVMISMQNIDTPDLERGESPFEILSTGDRPQQAKFDLTFRVGESTDRLLFSCVYRCSLWEASTIQRFCGYFTNICAQVAEQPHITIGAIEILSTEERNRLLVELNDTAEQLPPHPVLWPMFQKTAAGMPDAVAMTAPLLPPADYRLEHQVTYQWLMERAETLSAVLSAKGIGPDRIVAVCAHRTVEMAAAILGVLRAGGAYLPIDPNCSPQRFEFLLKDSVASVVVCDSASKPQCQELECCPHYIEIDAVAAGVDTATDLETAEPHHLAYIIYTSGSTGQPKGVLVEHRNAVNTVQWFLNRYQLTPKERVLQLTRYTFDASVNQIFGSLFSGVRLCVADWERMDNLQQLKGDIRRQRITLVNFVPRLLGELFDDTRRLGDVTTIVSGGESLEVGLKDRLLQAGYRVDNQYGPTETTIDALAEECAAGPVTLGRPIANTQCYILDRAGRLCAPGVAGELCVAGAGLARGYLNNPELTNRLFVDNPFGYGRMYRTGDVCRLAADRRFQFVGRWDRQVKIRGNRVELGEIEAIILEHNAIEETVVVTEHRDGGPPALIAYVTLALPDEGEKLEETWRAWLRERVPSYMLPDYLVTIDQIPLTANGKLDINALPEPDTVATDGFLQPTTPTQQALAAIWRRVLKRNRVGVGDNFFQMGGNSLNVLQLMGGLHHEFGVDWPLTRIFQTPVLKDQAALLAGDKTGIALVEPGLLLNKPRERYLFCFAPGIGFGLAYLQLAELLDDVALFAFDYVDDPHIIERYADTIQRRQPIGPILLLGYSAGGKVAVKTAQLLEGRGRRVQDIILLDCYNRHLELSPQEVEEMDREFLSTLKAGMQAFNLEFMLDQVLETMNRYRDFHHRLSLVGEVETQIHLIRAEGAQPEAEGWQAFTTIPQQDYSGYGSHREMLTYGYINKNCAIIKNILNSVRLTSSGDFSLTPETLAIHRRLSPTAARFLEYVSRRPEAMDAANYQKILADDNFFKMHPWPVFVDNRQAKEMETATMSVFKLIRDIPGRLFGNDIARMSAYYQLPEAMVAIQVEGIVQPHYSHLLARGDYVLSPEGLKCIEYNVVSNLGGLQIPHWEQLYLKNPIIGSFVDQAGIRLKPAQLLPLFFRNLVEGALAFNADPGGRMNVAIVFQDYNEDQIASALTLKEYLEDVYRRELENLEKIQNGRVFVCDFPHMKIRDDGLYHNGNKIDIVVEMLGGTVPPEILKLFKNRSLFLLNGPVTGLLSNKLNLALLSENRENPVFTPEEQETIGRYVPWSRSLVPGSRTTYDGVTVNLEDFVIQEKDRLVMKPASRYGGAGVSIGKNTDPVEWRDMLRRAFVEKRWLVQEYHRSYPWLFQAGECGIEPHDIVWGFFALGPYYGGGCVRLLPQSNRSGVINVHQGATSSMVFEVDE